MQCVFGLDMETNKGTKGKKRKKRWGGGASGFLRTVPSTSVQLACLLLNQTAWLVLVLGVLTPPPPAPEPSFSVSFLFVWLKTWSFQSQAAHWERRRRRRRRRGRKAQERRTEGRLAGRRQRETLNTPELGLIYFINRDYKFNLQTRGQNFSLTRGPWRTSGLGDHSYY